MPLYGGNAHRHDLVAKPRLIGAVGHRERVGIAGAGQDCLALRDGAVRVAAQAGEEVIPVQKRLVQRLAVIAVFDVVIHHIPLRALVKREIVFADNADLRRLLALVQRHPIKAVEAVQYRLTVGAARRRSVRLRPCLPDGQGTRGVFDRAVVRKQHVQLRRPAGTGRPGQNIAVIPAKLRGHQVAGRHALHENAARVDLVFFMHFGDERLQKIQVVIFVVIGRHLRKLPVAKKSGRMVIEHALHLPDTRLVRVREHADEALAIRHHCPRGINRMAPARH